MIQQTVFPFTCDGLPKKVSEVHPGDTSSWGKKI